MTLIGGLALRTKLEIAAGIAAAIFIVLLVLNARDAGERAARGAADALEAKTNKARADSIERENVALAGARARDNSARVAADLAARNSRAISNAAVAETKTLRAAVALLTDTTVSIAGDTVTIFAIPRAVGKLIHSQDSTIEKLSATVALDSIDAVRSAAELAGVKLQLAGEEKRATSLEDANAARARQIKTIKPSWKDRLGFTTGLGCAIGVAGNSACGLVVGGTIKLFP